MSERRRRLDRRLHVAAAIATCLLVPWARAAEPEGAGAGAVELSLADLLRSAVRNDPLSVAAARDVEVAAAERSAMAGRRYPSVTSLLLAGPTPEARGDAVRSSTPVDDYGDLIRSLGPFFRAELSVTQPLYTFGKLAAAESGLGKLVDVRRAQAATTRWEIVTQVKSAYYGLLLVEDLLALAGEVRGYLDQARRHLDARLDREDADVTPIDRAKLTVYESELETQRIELVKRRAVLRDAIVRSGTPCVPGPGPISSWPAASATASLRTGIARRAPSRRTTSTSSTPASRSGCVTTGPPASTVPRSPGSPPRSPRSRPGGRHSPRRCRTSWWRRSTSGARRPRRSRRRSAA